MITMVLTRATTCDIPASKVQPVKATPARWMPHPHPIKTSPTSPFSFPIPPSKACPREISRSESTSSRPVRSETALRAMDG